VKVINKGNGSRGVPIYLVIFLLFVDQGSLLIIFLSWQSISTCLQDFFYSYD